MASKTTPPPASQTTPPPASQTTATATEEPAPIQGAAPSPAVYLPGTAYVPPPRDPGGITRFTGPVLSGKSIPGVGLLAKRISIDASRGGSFSAPIPVPPGAVLLWVGVTVTTAFTPTTTPAQVSLGTTANGVDIYAATNIPSTLTTTLSAPLIGTVSGNTVYFSFIAGTATAGKASLFLIYLWPATFAQEAS